MIIRFWSCFQSQRVQFESDHVTMHRELQELNDDDDVEEDDDDDGSWRTKHGVTAKTTDCVEYVEESDSLQNVRFTVVLQQHSDFKKTV